MAQCANGQRTIPQPDMRVDAQPTMSDLTSVVDGMMYDITPTAHQDTAVSGVMRDAGDESNDDDDGDGKWSDGSVLGGLLLQSMHICHCGVLTV